MLTRITTGLIAGGLALVGAAIVAQPAMAGEPIARHAVLTANDNDSTIQLVRHGWRRGGWGGYGGYGYYRPYRWGGYRPYRSYWGPGYGYGYPAYGYGYSYPGYSYYNPGFGVYYY